METQDIVETVVQSETFDIRKEYVQYSPFLSTLMETDVGTQKDHSNRFVIDADIECFKQYLQFLQGEDFKMDEKVAALFDFMGHKNHLKLDLDDWKVLLQDQWIRDNMYKFQLYDDPFYGLVQLPLHRKIEVYTFDQKKRHTYVPPTGTIIAGSAALWMAGKIDKYSDVDHFFVCPKEQAEQIIGEIQNPVVTRHTVNTRIDDVKMSYILRLYKAPTEVVHGFDVDCCGILYDPETNSIWATRRAYHAIQKKVNIFNPERASPSYASRLIKYLRRGSYRIHLPLLTQDKIRRDVYSKMCKDIAMCATSRRIELEEHLMYYGLNGREITACAVSAMEMLNPVFQLISTNREQKVNLIDHIGKLGYYPSKYNIFALLLRSMKSTDHKMQGVIEYLHRDPASLLILATQFSFYAAVPNISDYDSNSGDLSTISWLEQNPMQQVSSTRYPAPIDNLEEWYSQSPLYGSIPTTETEDLFDQYDLGP